MTAYIPMIIAALTGIIGAFEPNINAYIAAHPSLAAGIAGVIAILTAIAKSPLTPKP